MLVTKSNNHWHSWHVGDPLFEFEYPVTEIQADGHELVWLETAIKAGRSEADKEYYKDIWGVK